MGFEGAVTDVGAVCQQNTPGKDCANGVGFGNDGRSYDGNACLWFGFACGFNYRDAEDVPDGNGGFVQIHRCFVPGLDNAPAQWSFLNSATCKGLTGGSSPFFVVRYLLSCDGKHACPAGRRFGFFEAVDASSDPSDAAFAAFRRKVVAANPSVFPNGDASSAAIEKEGVYRTFGNVLLHFEIVGGPSRVTSVFGGVRVPEISDWPFLDGDVLNAKGDGIVTFKNPRTKLSILWDFSDVKNPKRSSQSP